MMETEEELHKKAKSGDEVRIGLDPLGGVCPTRKLYVSGPNQSLENVHLCSMCYVREISVW
jgi:hypothetical protein